MLQRWEVSTEEQAKKHSERSRNGKNDIKSKDFGYAGWQ